MINSAISDNFKDYMKVILILRKKTMSQLAISLSYF